MIPILISVMLLSACNDSDGGGDSSSKTELEGKWGFPLDVATLIFSGKEYDLSIPDISDIPGVDCSDFDDLVLEDPCSLEEINSSGTFSIGDSFQNNRGETVKKINFSQELLNGKADSYEGLATYRIEDDFPKRLYLGDQSGDLVDYPLFKK